MDTDKIVAAILAAAWFAKQDNQEADITEKFTSLYNTVRNIKPDRNPTVTKASRL